MHVVCIRRRRIKVELPLLLLLLLLLLLYAKVRLHYCCVQIIPPTPMAAIAGTGIDSTYSISTLHPI